MSGADGGGTAVGTRSRLVVHDNLDDRREIHQLLTRLSPASRVWFLARCARKCAVQKGNPLRVSLKTHQLARLARWDDSADRRLTNEVWTDLWMLCSQYDLDVDAELPTLVALAKKGNR